MGIAWARHQTDSESTAERSGSFVAQLVGKAINTAQL
jgi:hypothetical protein